RLWRPLLDRLVEGASRDAGWSVRAAFQGASPERVNLGFNRIRGFRQDYVTFVLGGGRSVWTNVQLAEAMSRLVTDQKVEPHLLSAVLSRDSGAASPAPYGSGAAEPLALDPAVRATVLSGLMRVVEGDRGTAAQLAPRLRALRAAFPGDRVVLFAKTGSPRLVRSVPREVLRPFTKLVARGRLALENGTLVARAGGTRVSYVRPESPGRAGFEAMLSQGLEEVGVHRNAVPVRTVILLAIDHLAEQISDGVRPADLVGPLRVGSQGLEFNLSDDFFTHRLMRSPGAVLEFSLVRVPGEGAAIPTPAELRNPGARVITVVIHLAAGPDSRLAVEAAGRILPELESLLRK
ncbi:MAG TPA: hypothetical protein VM890_13490, partial [Longimicrobium sp.]|nr:hypothetical protein [Longimicrobium sp.]